MPPKSYLNANVMRHQRTLWNHHFNIKDRLSQYSFDFSIHTDGVSASIRYIQERDLAENNQRKRNKLQANADARALSKEERERRKSARSELVPETYKGRTDGDDDDEVEYLTKLNKEDLEEVREKCRDQNFIVIDPGKRDLFTAMKVDENNPKEKPKIVRYSYRQHLRETKRLKYQRIIRNHRKEDRQLFEEILSEFNGKTVDSVSYTHLTLPTILLV